MNLFNTGLKILIKIGRPAYWLIRKIYIFVRHYQKKLAVELSKNHLKYKVKKVNFKKIEKKRIKVGISRRSVLYLSLSTLLISLSVGVAYLYNETLASIPDINLIYSPPNLSTKILDRHGRLLYKFYVNENRSWTPLEKIPQSLKLATLAIEDKEFYKHYGLSFKGIIQAIRHNFTKNSDGKLRGGSTITQQLVKNVFLSNEKTWTRKVKEALLSLLIERKLSKDEILERYFNQVPYGGDTYGVQEASLKYFGKNVWEIDTAQATFLAGLPAAPGSYSPFGDNPEYAYKRQREVIQEMLEAGFLSEGKVNEILEKKVEVIKSKNSISAPHFVFYVKDILGKKYGYENFERRGLTVTTSLDLDVQRFAETIVKDEISKVKKLRISNGAAVVIDPRNGDVMAMVGSKDYYATDIDGKYNVTTGLRQPGSSIKPINYLLALQNNKSLMTVIDDAPVTYQVKGQKPYSPQNYNGRYMGKVTLKTALASSLNIPSVKLLNENGVENMINLGKKMGITSWEEKNRFGLSLALGSGEVKMIDLSQAYSIFANMGDKVEINAVLIVQNYMGEVIYSKKVIKERIIEPGHAFLINSALSDDLARAPIFGLNSKLKIQGKNVAVKTGTTNSLKDNWCIGWTPSVLVAAWVGNNDSSPMSWVASGVSGATPIWNRIMTEMTLDKGLEKWETPYSIYKANVCGKEEYFMDGTEIGVKCASSSASLNPTPTANH